MQIWTAVVLLTSAKILKGNTKEFKEALEITSIYGMHGIEHKAPISSKIHVLIFLEWLAGGSVFCIS